MLTLVVVVYFILSLVCSVIIYAACVIASRSNELVHTEELSTFERTNEGVGRLGRANSASGVAAKVSNLFSPTSSLS